MQVSMKFYSIVEFENLQDKIDTILSRFNVCKNRNMWVQRQYLNLASEELHMLWPLFSFYQHVLICFSFLTLHCTTLHFIHFTAFLSTSTLSSQHSSQHSPSSLIKETDQTWFSLETMKTSFIKNHTKKKSIKKKSWKKSGDSMV